MVDRVLIGSMVDVWDKDVDDLMWNLSQEFDTTDPVEIIKNLYAQRRELLIELEEWRQAAEEAQTAQVGNQIPVVGALSKDTTPADFERFALIAREYHADKA